MGARTPILEEMHLWVLLAYSSALFVLAGACWLGARLVRRATERQDSLEAEQAKKGEYMPWATVRSVASSAPATPWRPRLEAALEVATWTLAWWGMSVTFTLVNKYFLGYWRPPVRDGQTVAPGFPFAVTTTTMHLSMKVLLSTATVKWRSRRLERRLASDEASHAEATAIVVPEPLTFRARWRFAVPVGASTALDIACSNLALIFITVSFYTVAKSSTLAWTLVWAVALRLEPCRLRTLVLVSLIIFGLVLATEGERRGSAGFSVPGFALVTAASCLGGLRWCLTQALFDQDEACAEDPVVVVYHVSPAGVATLLPIALGLEARHLWHWASLVAPEALGQAFVAAAAAGGVAYAMLLAEVRLLHSTSSLSLSVFGALKDVSQMALAAFTFGDELTPQSIAGLGVVLAASLAYARFRERLKPSDEGRRRRQPRYRRVGAASYDADIDGNGLEDDDLMDDDLNDNTLELVDI